MTPLCQNLPAERWDDVNPPNPEAVRVCFACPLIEDCYQAINTTVRRNTDDACLWGATTPSQRARIRRGWITLEDAWAESRALLDAYDAEVREQMAWFVMQSDERCAA